MISKRAKALLPSPTLAMAARAKDLAAKGNDVVSLTVGEPDWPTFKTAADAGIQAIQAGKTKYTPAAGIPELRQAVADSYKKQLGITYSKEDVVVAAGAKFVIYSALQCLVDPGDEVIIPAPYWVSYPAMTELCGGKPVFVSCGEKEKFRMSASALESAITAKTKALILCSPGNPTGLCYSEAELKDIAQVLKKHPAVVVISDDIYNRLMFSDQMVAPHLLHVAPELRDRLIAVNGAAKTYSMTGWRIGWGAGPLPVMKAMADFVSQTTSNVASMSQYAALEALKSCDPDVAQARGLLKDKMYSFMKQISAIPGIKVFEPQGAFYLWISIENWLGKTYAPKSTKIKNSKELADLLLDEHFLATVPGIEFGTEGYLRLSFATDNNSLDKAVKRLREFQTQLK